MRRCLGAAATALLLVPAGAQADLRGDLRRALRAAGPASGLAVHDVTRDRPVLSIRGSTVRSLGSNAKLFTIAAALRALGADGHMGTTVIGTPDAAGTVPGDLHVYGGGDPSFDRASLDRLADAVAARVRVVRGGIVGDENLFDTWRGPFGNAFEPELRGVLGSLVYDRGRAVDGGPVQADPGRAFASRFDDALEARGVTIHGVPRAGQAPGYIDSLAVEHSQPVRRLVATVGKHSDNFVAEMLTKSIAVPVDVPASTAVGASEIVRHVGELGAKVKLLDGSGLARADRASPREVVDLLRAMAHDRAFTGALAVAGVDGTVRRRMRRGPARGRCRVKTGTLPSARVSALSGYCRGRSGRTYAFSILIERRRERIAERVEDAVARRLAAA